MEPPAKRRRQGYSPFNSSDPLDAEPESDEDVSLHNTYVEPEDDSYQLAIKRMQASQKFQATFAHIIEKYSQNFDGIGDEIDMETGEIVVNNGHLNHMRHEADIGGGWGNEPIDSTVDGVEEDDGFVLEDFIDGFSDDDDNELQEDTNHDKKEGGSPGNPEPTENNKDEEEIVREEPIAPVETNAMVPVSNSGAVALPQNIQGGQVGNPASFFSNLYGGLFMGFIPAFGSVQGNAVPQGNSGASLPACFGAPPNGQVSPFPFMFNPWAAAGLLPPQSWGQMGVSIQSQQNWGHSNPPMPPQLPAVPSPEKPKVERYNFPVQRGDTSIWAPDSRQEDDNSPPKQKNKTPKSRGRKVNRLPSSPLGFGKGGANKESVQSSNTNHENRRASGRVRKQVEYLGKISWLEADKNTPGQRSSQQSAADVEDHISSDKEDLTNEEGGTMASESVGPTQSSDKLNDLSKFNPGLVIPDSQDSATPPASSAQLSQSSQPDKEPIRSNTSSGNYDASVFALSDDEAPLILQRTTTVDTGGTSTKPTVETLIKKDAIDPTVVRPQKEQSIPDPPKKRPRGRPRKRPLDSPGDTPGPNHNVEYTKQVPSSPKIRCKMEMKWLQRGLPKSPASTVPLDATDEAEEMAHDQARSSPKAPRSTRSKSLFKPRERAMEVEQEVHGHEPSSPVPTVDPPATEETLAPAVEQKSPDTKRASKSPTPIPATDDEASISNAEDLPPLPAPEESLASSPPSTKEQTPPVHKSSTISPQKLTPSRPRPRPSKPQTPSHTAIHTCSAPSSRRSLLSLVSNQDSDSESDKDLDELGHSHSFRPSPFGPRSASTSTRKTWRSSALTREVYRTPVKKRIGDPVSPSSIIRTPGGTVRTCGVDGYQCGRDFCFTCL